MNPFDDYFYLLLANWMVAFPKLRDYFDRLYETQKMRFYEKAKTHKYYNHLLMQDKPLALEVTMKRTFGILLCSQEDGQLQADIIKQINQIYPQIENLCRDFSLKKYEKLEGEHYARCDAKRTSADEQNSFFYFVAYELYCIQGIEPENSDIQSIYTSVAADMDNRQLYNPTSVGDMIDAVEAMEIMQLPRDQRKIYKAIRNGYDILDLAYAYELRCNAGNPFHSTRYVKRKEDLLRPILTANETDYFTALALLHILGIQFDLYGLSIAEYFEGINISRKESDRALKIVARELDTYFVDEKKSCTLTLYLNALFYGQLAKMLKESKNFYFENNSETQYNELGKVSEANAVLQEEVNRLREAVNYQEQLNSVLKTQIESLSTELSKDTKEAMRPLMNEISLLRAQIAELEKELAAEREKVDELNRLREFAFSIHSGSDIPDTKVSLEDLIAGKKIFIFGGHINWRNKMKAAYPTLNVLDGHQTSFDERMLLDADMVLFNTGNMSHTLYYKVMDVLRKNEIPFDYIGKYWNAELLEQEMAEVLQK